MILEAPAPQFESGVRVLRDARWKVVYDIVDLWSDPSLGGEWYRQAVEIAYLKSADEVTASATDLVEHASKLGRSARLVPNAVNSAVFSVAAGAVPADFPPGDGPVFGYHGSLYGDWFDWSQVVAIANQHPSARVVLIGDIPSEHPVVPRNVHFLGLKPQGSLPDYLTQFDVGLIPFRRLANHARGESAQSLRIPGMWGSGRGHAIAFTRRYCRRRDGVAPH